MANLYPSKPSLNIIDATPDKQYAVFAVFQSTIDTLPMLGEVFAKGCQLLDLDTGVKYVNSGTVSVPSWEPEVSGLYALKQISSAELLNLFSNPVLLVPAPGAGKFISPRLGICVYHFGTVAYSNPGNTNIKMGANNVFQLGTSLNAGASFIAQFGVSFINLLENQALYFTNTVGNPINGDGDVIVYVEYTIKNSTIA